MKSIAETWKIAKNAKSVVTEDGITLTYCEFGEENEDVILSGAFYFHTWLPVLEMLGKQYHVYGIVMRYGDGEGTEFNPDGTIHWSRQWGDDIYKFARALGIQKFHYLGKCHGTLPGWYMAKNHPDMIQSLCSFYLAPHITEPDGNQWGEALKSSRETLVQKVMRHTETGVPKKMAELKSLSAGPEGYGQTPPDTRYISSSNLMWDSNAECEAFLKEMETPVCYMFGTEDILFQDWESNNMKVIAETNRAKAILLQGEKHLMELDCPERIASECSFFIQETMKHYD